MEKMVQVKILEKKMFSGKRLTVSQDIWTDLLRVIINIIYFQTFFQDFFHDAGKILKPSL